MKRIGLIPVIAIGLGFAHSAMAADMGVRAAPVYVAPVAPTWTGFYAGLNGGWGWSNFNGTFAAAGPVALATGFGPLPSLSTHNNGGVFGGQLGYNWQAANWVFGVEGDMDAASINGTQQAVFPSGTAPFTDGVQFKENVNWLATVRGRLGYTWGPGMIYITGGGAWENATVKALASEGFVGASAAGNFTFTKSGWTIGTGYEWMLAPNWTVRGEYLYYGFSGNNGNTVGFAGAPGSTFTVASNKQNISVFRVGLNYKFDWGRY